METEHNVLPRHRSVFAAALPLSLVLSLPLSCISRWFCRCLCRAFIVGSIDAFVVYYKSCREYPKQRKGLFMTIQLALNEMSMDEKLMLMEQLWDDISSSSGSEASPQWHADVLDARMRAVEEGRTVFVSWDGAKCRLRDRIK